jgi:hypothetical protein
MNLLDTASLVVTPNGYKASKLYSIVPSDGTGDMTFARTGDTATRVNSSGLIETVLANKPRLDYLGSTCPKLLLEPQRTNVLTYSSAFENADWVATNLTVTADSITSPDGTTNADLFTFGTTAGNLYQTKTVTASTAYTISYYVKSGTLTTGYFAAYDLSNNAFIFQNQSYTITSSWTRVSYTFTTPAGCTSIRIFPCRSVSATGTFYAYGAQLEAGAYATSYIPTTTASVTRNVDLASKTSATTLIGQTEGTIFWDVNIYGVGSAYESLFNIDNGAYGDTIYLATAGTFSFGVISGGVTQAGYSFTVTTGRHKIALAYKANDFVFYVDGVLRHTDTSGTIPPLSRIQLGNTVLGPSQSHINSAALWKTKLQNSELATLTSL